MSASLLPEDLEGRVQAILERARIDLAPCPCHSVPPGCCPGPVSHPPSLAPFIDHTLLSAEATPERIRRLCDEGRGFGFRTVCVNPVYVGLCAGLLRGSRTGVCTVAGFPLGASGDSKAEEARRALAGGAWEVDMVVWLGGLLGGDWGGVVGEIRAVAEVCHAAGGLAKVILETSALTPEGIVRGALLAEVGGADYVKTSTGFSSGGATPAAVALLRLAVPPRMGVKASGGIRDLATARLMLALGATRLGTSAGVALLEEEARGA
jgi:deoxyribose-phosphate aldolase